MRFMSSLFRGISLEHAPLLSGRSMTARAMIIGVPFLLGILLLIFILVGRSVAVIMENALTRNALLQVQAMGVALENVLRETRNQLLLLAAGPVNPQTIERAFALRAERDGENFREVAFVGLTPEDRFLFVNHKGQIIKVPPNIARESPGGPFQTGSQLPASHVGLSRPLEISYAMLPVGGDLENIVFQALRFSTPVHDADGNFLGVLSLALDLGVLRDRLSLFNNLGYDQQSFFFDREGWLMFQAGGEAGSPLSSDSVRAGFKGDFGRPGFSRAFRPAPEHLNYWTMVADVQSENSGLMPVPINASAADTEFFYKGGASYAPVMWQSHESEPVRVMGGIALLNDDLTAASNSQRLYGIYAVAMLGAVLLGALFLYYLPRALSRPLALITTQINERNASGSVEKLELPVLPRELEELRESINGILARLGRARDTESAQAQARSQHWLRQPAPIPSGPPGQAQQLVGSSEAMTSLLARIEKAARTDADILIVGETGTGKELVAASVHKYSPRASGPFISINCGALDEALLMDTLFGHVKGAFTEARAERKGAFLAATGGTLLLDEIGNATPRVQQALLRALSTRHIRPLGSDVDVAFDARIIAATNAPLKDGQHDFRNDLYYRLAVITLTTPPLREHKEDIPVLVGYFIRSICQNPANAPRMSRGALEKLINYDWPGNVRELKNVLTRATAFSDGRMIMAEDLLADETGLTQQSQEPDKQAMQTAPLPGLNVRQAEILRKLVPLGRFTRLEYERAAAGMISSRTAQYDLKLMTKLGFLRREGRGPTQSYTVVDALPDVPVER